MSVTALQTITIYEPLRVINEQVTGLIAIAEQDLALSYFGNRYGEAVGLKVLHMLACIAQGIGAAGPVIHESEGQLSRTYANPYRGNITFDDLDSTFYGKQLKSLMKSINILPLNRMM